MIKALTPEQATKLSQYRDKWLDIGLSTKRANRSAAETAAKAAYKEAGLKEPQIFIWLDSPYQGVIGARLIKEIAKKYDTFKADQVGGQVGGQVGDQVRGQVGGQVWDQVGGQVGGQVGDQVRGQVGGQVWDQVGGQVGGQVGDQVRGQVWDQVWDQVRGQVWDQVWDQVRGQVGDQVRGQVGDQVRGQVGGQVWDQVGGQVGDQVGDQVRGQVGGQVWDQVGGQVGDQVGKTDLWREWNELGFWGSMDAYWLSFYSYFLEVCELECCKRLVPLMTLAQEVGVTWFYENVVIFTERPVEIMRDTENRLHSLHTAAVKYADGYSVYAIHGMRLPENIVTIPAEEITKEMIIGEGNADYRRCLVQRVGIDKAIEILGAEIADQEVYEVGGQYELLLIDYQGDGEQRPYLKMINPSLGVAHIEGVQGDTVEEALCFRNDLVKWIPPVSLS